MRGPINPSSHQSRCERTKSWHHSNESSVPQLTCLCSLLYSKKSSPAFFSVS